MLCRPRQAEWLVAVAARTVAEIRVDRPDEVRGVVHGVYRKLYEKNQVWWRPAWYRARWLDVGLPALRDAGLTGRRDRRRVAAGGAAGVTAALGALAREDALVHTVLPLI
jgi:hypothetical protein